MTKALSASTLADRLIKSSGSDAIKNAIAQAIAQGDLVLADRALKMLGL